MYSKPVTSPADGLRNAPARTVHRAPLSSATFASYLPQGAAQSASQSEAPLEQPAARGAFGLNRMTALAALGAANAKRDEASPAKDSGREDALASQGLPLNPRDIFRLLAKGKVADAESTETSVRVKAHRKKEADADTNRSDAASRKLRNVLQSFRQNFAGGDVGALAARFESGAEGVSAIGYDRHGGTSYGKYQISSRAGTMKHFIGFLQQEAPDIAEKLQKAGPANTGGKQGKMPETWKKIAEEQPERFEALQERFIRTSHFEPAMRAIAEKAGVDSNDMPFALREVIFSTAVQHGPDAASRIVSRALDQMGEKALDPKKNAPADLAKAQENLIRKIYQNRSGQFQSSTEAVQTAVKSRLRQEMGMAISMLRTGDGPAKA